MVRLKDLCKRLYDCTVIHFNSSMVRLKVFASCTDVYCSSAISIPVWCDWRLRWNTILSYSWKISIPVWCDWRSPLSFLATIRLLNFNSSMVRLKEWGSAFNKSKRHPFQFQYGAIEGIYHRCFWDTYYIISIPVWCDWRQKMIWLTTWLSTISIPVWCDWRSRK